MNHPNPRHWSIDPNDRWTSIHGDFILSTHHVSDLTVRCHTDELNIRIISSKLEGHLLMHGRQPHEVHFACKKQPVAELIEVHNIERVTGPIFKFKAFACGKTCSVRTSG